MGQAFFVLRFYSAKTGIDPSRGENYDPPAFLNPVSS